MIQINPPPLTKGQVHIWLAELDRPTEQQKALAQHLSPDEQARAIRFIDSRASKRFTAGRGLLRTILGTYLSISPPEVQFNYGVQGKPGLAHPDQEMIKFNLSHSGRYTLVAISPGTDVGVDIEEKRPLDNLEVITRRYFSVQEKEAIRSLPPIDQVNAFYDCWTRKEAFIKACGDGFSIPLDSFSVSLGPKESNLILDPTSTIPPQTSWQIIPLSPPQGYAGAIATQGNHTLQHFNIPT